MAAKNNPASRSVGARTDAAGREENEDACAVVAVGPYDIIIVADGAGGHAAGEVASAQVIGAATHYFETVDVLRKPLAEVMEGALHASHRAVRDTMKTDRKLRDMRTTALIVIGTPTEAWVGHVGDSRAYLVRDGNAERLTRDDSLVQSLIDIGQLDEEAAKKHSKSNVLTQSIGDPKALEYHVKGPIEVRSGDRIVACSDGLWETVNDASLAEIASSSADPTAVATKLVDQAIAAHASDNVTVGVMHWSAAGRRPQTAKHRVEPVRREVRRREDARRQQNNNLLLLLALLAFVVGAAAAARWYREHAHAQTSAP